MLIAPGLVGFLMSWHPVIERPCWAIKSSKLSHPHPTHRPHPTSKIYSPTKFPTNTVCGRAVKEIEAGRGGVWPT